MDYKDDATAFNGEKKGTIASKGVVNNKMSAIIFKQLEKRRTDASRKAAQRQRDSGKGGQNPSSGGYHTQCGCRFLLSRYGVEEGTELAKTVLEFSYKNDALGDPLINDDHILVLRLATQEQLDTVRKYAFMETIF